MFMYDGVEEFSIPPAGAEVVTTEALVTIRHPLWPKKELLLGRHIFRLAVDLNIRDLNSCKGIM